MAVRLLAVFLLCIAFASSPAAAPQAAESFPWGPQVRCALNPARPGGLHPDALAALQGLSLAHRITQGINNRTSVRGNVHSTDGYVNGQAYTGAVDISVRCLTDEQIKSLSGHLAHSGFAAWYRKKGQDGWNGDPHIHAVWAGAPLKAVLRQQIENWLAGRNGLASNMVYQFWQPSQEMKAKVEGLYRSNN